MTPSTTTQTGSHSHNTKLEDGKKKLDYATCRFCKSTGKMIYWWQVPDWTFEEWKEFISTGLTPAEKNKNAAYQIGGPKWKA